MSPRGLSSLLPSSVPGVYPDPAGESSANSVSILGFLRFLNFELSTFNSELPFSLFRILATRHSTATASLLRSLCGNSVISVVSLFPLFPDFSLATRHSSLANKSNYSRTYAPSARKSNYSRTYEKHGGGGCHLQNIPPYNSFVFFHYVNYSIN